MRIVIDILIVISILFSIAGVIGMIRMPDTYSRLQSSTNIATMGVMGVIIAAILYSLIFLHDPSMAIKLAALLVFYLITNPIGSHALARASYRAKIKPSDKTVCDQYGADMEEVPGTFEEDKHDVMEHHASYAAGDGSKEPENGMPDTEGKYDV